MYPLWILFITKILLPATAASTGSVPFFPDFLFKRKKNPLNFESFKI